MPEEEEPKGGGKEGLRHAEEEVGKRRNTCQEVETIEHICRYTKCHISSTCHAFNMHWIYNCSKWHVSCMIWCVCLFSSVCHTAIWLQYVFARKWHVSCMILCACVFHLLDMHSLWLQYLLTRKLHVSYMIMCACVFHLLSRCTYQPRRCRNDAMS